MFQPLAQAYQLPSGTEEEKKLLPAKAMESEVCPYHKGGVFTLPPAMEWYYRPYHPEYNATTVKAEESPLQFIYPEPSSILYLPRQMDGSAGAVVFQLASRNPAGAVWWHLDGDYLGETRHIHQMTLSPAPGPHDLVVVDTEGNTAAVHFTIAENKSGLFKK